MGLFEKLYSQCQGFYDLRALAPKKPPVQRFIKLFDAGSLQAFVKEYRGKGYNLYFGVSTRDGNGGTKENIVNIPAVWCEMDFKSQDQVVCDKKLEEFPFHPTVKVASGGGYHLYWCLREPCDKSDIGQVEATLKAICNHLGGDPACTDASRILRIPLTLNQKYDPPRQVKVIYENGTFYNLSDFEDVLDIRVAEPLSGSSLAGVESKALDRIMTCSFMRYCQEHAATLDEPVWYAMITQLCRERGGPELIHKLSRPYAKGHSQRYSENETNKKILHAINAAGPLTCEKIGELWKCENDTCDVRSPAALAYRTDFDPFPQADVIDVNDAMCRTDAIGGACRKIDASVTQRSDGSKRNMTDEVREWLTSAEGIFSYQDLARDLQLLNLKPLSASSKAIANLRRILQRLTEDKVLERSGTRTGMYRVRDTQLSPLKWRDATSAEFPVILPLGLSELVKIHPKTIIVVAGDRNSAKTAFLLNVALLNMAKMDCHYFTSEMGPEEFRERLEGFEDIELSRWEKLNVWDRSGDFHDVVFPNDLNIIDFLELETDFFQVTAKIARIWERLDKGVAIIGLQKKIGAVHGRGGDFSAEKARLYVTFSLDETPEGISNIGKILKAKNYRNKAQNPNGFTMRFKVFNGTTLYPVCEWGNHRTI